MEVDDELTIDELAAEVHMTVRNIRAHQSRGLLPPPRIVGRTGFYGRAHRSRLHQIRRLQDEGLNLAAIARVVEDGRLTAVATGPFADVSPEYRQAGELAERLHLDPDDPAIERAVELGLITPEADGVRVEHPRLIAVAEQLSAQGVPLDAMLHVVADVQLACAEVARAFLTLADEYLVAHLVVGTRGDLDQLNGAVERLHGQASATLEVLFNQAMSTAIRAYLDPATGGPEALERLGSPGRRPPRARSASRPAWLPGP